MLSIKHTTPILFLLLINTYGCPTETDNNTSAQLIDAEKLCQTPMSYVGKTIKVNAVNLTPLQGCTQKGCLNDMGQDTGDGCCNECMTSGFTINCAGDTWIEVPKQDAINIYDAMGTTSTDTSSFSCSGSYCNFVCSPEVPKTNTVTGTFKQNSTGGYELMVTRVDLK